MAEQQPQQSQPPWKVGVCVTLALTIIPAILSNLDKITSLLPTSKSSADILISPPPNPTVESNPKQNYYVIAAESNFPDSLRQEPARAAGLEFSRSFPNIKICPSKVDPEKYYLVLGSNLSEAEAKALIQQAVVRGFNKETYKQTEDEIFFVPSNCSAVTQ